MPKNNSIQIRRGLNSEWVSSNPTLSSGELGFETDTLRLKIGNGIAWSGLNYVGSKETLSLVRNDTGDLISAGQALYVSGIYNNSTPSVAKYVADGSISENLFIGLANSNISNNSHGYATSFGQIDNLNTVGNALNALSIFGEPAWANGTLLYAHPTAAGKLTSIPPTRAILIGTVIYAHGTQGKIFVRSKSYGLLDNLYDVNTSSASNNQYLQYNSASSSWISTSSGIFNDINVNNNTINITSSGSSQPNLILFNDSSTPNSYSVGSISNGMRLLLSSNNSLGHNAIGVDYAGNNNTWFSVPSGMSFKFFDGNDTIFSISRTAINYNGSGLVYGAGGTTNYLSKFTGGSILANSLIFDNGTNVGIGTTSPAANLHVNGSGIFSSGLNVNGNIKIDNNQLYINKTGIFLPFGSSLIPAIKISGYFTSTYTTMDNVICNELNVNNNLYVPTSDESQTSPGLFFSTGGGGVAGISSNLYGDTVTILVNNLSNSLVQSATFDAFGINTQQITAEQKFFKIKHPDPESGYSHLQYGSLESPYNGVRLTGKDKLNKGVCEVYLPDYLKHLIYEEDVSIQLTNYGHHKMLYVDKIDLKNNKFIVKGYRSKSGGPFNFYWSFTGIRKDVSILIPEQ
jgi:hypothetical protein